MSDVLATLESYYDTAPRTSATAVEVGPFTLFVADADLGYPFYARPRLGLDATVARSEVDRLREQQRLLGVPETLEWVHETTPSLLGAARASGLEVAECPLLVLDALPATLPAADVRLLGPGDDLAAVQAAVHAAFGGSDEPLPTPVGRRPQLVEQGLLVVAAAYDDEGTLVGGGSHSPRGATTELTGVGTVFLSAQDDAVARVYERVGFARVGTACIAASPEVGS